MSGKLPDLRDVSEPLTATSEYGISLASGEDIPELLALQEANLGAHGGMLSVRLTAEWFERSLPEMPIILARCSGRLVGYLVSSSRSATAHLALPQAKFRAYPAGPDAYNSGPLCISQSERGRGLAATLFRALHERLPGREAVTFVRRDNTASRNAHAKAGFREVAQFSYEGVDYMVMACSG
jgi:predicted GNAT superfamily acetyltransferase